MLSSFVQPVAQLHKRAYEEGPCEVSWSVYKDQKKNFPDSKQGEEKTSLLRQERGNFLIIREGYPGMHGPVCFYGQRQRREERVYHTPADLLIA